MLYPGESLLTLAGQNQPTGLTLEEGIPQMRFKTGDLAAYGPLGDMQLLCCTSEVTVVGCDQKRMQGCERWEAFHRIKP